MSAPALDAGGLVDRLLNDIAGNLGHPVPAPYATALHAVPRHLFLPDRIWRRDGKGGHALCDRGADPQAWLDAAYTDTPLVTQFSDPGTTADGGGHQPSSSASMPSMVIAALRDAELAGTSRVLEIGAGTGFNAALLAAHLGGASVTSVEIDNGLVKVARENIAAAGYAPAIICADGTGGWPDNAPYDRILATCSVRTVPPAWVQQTATGGRIITPWDSAWCCYGTLTLTKHSDGSASGPFAPYGSYMTIRGQHPDIDLERDVLRAGQCPARTTTSLSPWAVAGGDLDAEFHLGLSVPGAWYTWDTTVAAAHTRLWLADTDATSWAAVDYDGQQTNSFAVSQFGPRRLWDQIEGAFRQWTHWGRPGVGRYGLTLAPSGEPTLWLDHPEHPLPS